MHIKTLAIGLLLLIIPPANAQAQTVGSIQCGDIVEGEVIAGQSQTLQGPRGEVTVDNYLLNVQAGTRVNLTVQPLGNTFNVGVVLVDSGGNDVQLINDAVEGLEEQLIDYPIGSSNQILRLLGTRPGYAGIRNFYHDYGANGYAGLYYGAYQIRLGCTLRDGTVIEPGDTLPDNNNAGSTSSLVAAPVFSGTGFPGLAPVDFANAFKLPLSLGTSMPGSIPPSGDAILGLTFDASAGDTFALDFARNSGNLNLGVVVLSANNEVVFQASLVTSQSLSTRLTLPSAGQYTIGVFRIDLLPPAAPEATQFQITGTLNP